MHRFLVQCRAAPGIQGTGHSINAVPYLVAVKNFTVGHEDCTLLPSQECTSNLIKILIRIKP